MRRWLRVLLGVPLLLWLTLNLFFATGWGTGLVAKVVESRFGFRSELNRVSWTPWSGVLIKEFKILPPSELEDFGEVLTVDSIQVDPSWWSLLQGRKRVERVEFRGVKGEVSLELLKAMMARGQTPAKEPPPPVPEEINPAPAESEPLVVGSEEGKSGSSDTAPPTPVPSDSSPQEDKKSMTLDDFKGTLVIRDADLKIYSEISPDLSVALEGVEGEIPLWGEGSEGRLKVGELKLGESSSLEDVELPVALSKRVLRVDDFAIKILGLDLELTAAVWMTAGLPCGIQVLVPSQSVDFSPVFRDGKSPIRIGELKSSAQIKGYLLKPRAIFGGSHTEFRNLEIRDQRDGSARWYESGRAHFRISPSGILAREFRLMGEEEAVMGNGFVTVAGEGAAVVRVVASPTRADSLEKRIRESVEELELTFTPLVTPDREFRDVRLEVRSGTLMTDLGVGRVWVPCLPAFRSVMGSPDPARLMVP